nr:hypothetical protein [Tanacetum cinerariifolium]
MYRGRQDQSVEYRGRQDQGYDLKRQDFRGQDQRSAGRNGNDHQDQDYLLPHDGFMLRRVVRRPRLQ